MILKIAPPYQEGEIGKISRGFEKLLGHEVRFRVVEDESLIGGFIAYIDGRVYDASLATQLGELRRRLKETGGRGSC